jgi:hypothetical protein
MEVLVRVHYMPPWIPVLHEPVKRLAKPRKFFATDETRESADQSAPAPRPSDILDEEMEEKRTDILA